MPYTKKQIERGLELATNESRTKWGLGNLILERPDATRQELEEFAEAIGLSYEQVTSYRNVADPNRGGFSLEQRRADVSWTVHRELSGRPDRVAILHERSTWTLRTVRQRIGRQAIDSPKLTEDDEVKVAQRVMNNPATASRVLEDPQVHRNTINASAQAFVDRTRRENPRWSPSPHSEQPTRLGHAAARAELEDCVATAIRTMQQGRKTWESRGQELDAAEKEVFADLLSRYAGEGSLMGLATLESISDTELSELLNGGN